MQRGSAAFWFGTTRKPTDASFAGARLTVSELESVIAARRLTKQNRLPSQSPPAERHAAEPGSQPEAKGREAGRQAGAGRQGVGVSELRCESSLHNQWTPGRRLGSLVELLRDSRVSTAKHGAPRVPAFLSVRVERTAESNV